MSGGQDYYTGMGKDKPESMTLDEAQKESVRVTNQQYNEYKAFTILQGQLGDLAKYIYHDPKEHPDSRPFGTPKDEEAAFGHTLMWVLVLAKKRGVDVEKGLASAHEALRQKDFMKSAPSDVGKLRGKVAHWDSVSAEYMEGTAYVRGSDAVFQASNILVLDHATPHDAGIIHAAGAVITNHGGELSHAATIAREFDVTCIVGTGNATEQIKTGNRVRIHKDGRIEVIR